MLCEVCVGLHDWLRRRDVPSELAHTLASVSDILGLVAQQLLSIQPASHRQAASSIARDQMNDSNYF